jgi:carbon-monoxide dehydrogenase medium subunit
MILPRFELAEPTSIQEACEILKKSSNAKVIAGGTDLLVNMKKKVIIADTLVSLDKIGELKDVSFSGESGITLGSMVRIADIAASPQIKEKYPILAVAAGKLGSPQVRNRATIGGNVCSARPAADTIGPLMAYEATARIAGPSGVREEAIGKIFKGPGQTTLARDEFLAAITIKAWNKNTGGSYIKYGIRRAMEIALVSITSLLSIENGACRTARVVLGAVGPTFIRCPVTEEFLTGKTITEEIAQQAGMLAMNACTPITDVRASADYRRQLVRALVKRSLMESASLEVN